MLINSAVVPFDALLAPIASKMFQGDVQIVSFLLSAAYQAAAVETDFVFICSGFIIIFLFVFAHMAAHFRSCR